MLPVFLAAGAREERTSWSKWFGSGGDETIDLAIAALQPLGNQADAVAELQTD